MAQQEWNMDSGHKGKLRAEVPKRATSSKRYLRHRAHKQGKQREIKKVDERQQKDRRTARTPSKLSKMQLRTWRISLLKRSWERIKGPSQGEQKKRRITLRDKWETAKNKRRMAGEAVNHSPNQRGNGRRTLRRRLLSGKEMRVTRRSRRGRIRGATRGRRRRIYEEEEVGKEAKLGEVRGKKELAKWKRRERTPRSGQR